MITTKLLISKQWYKKPFGISKSEFVPIDDYAKDGGDRRGTFYQVALHSLIEFLWNR